jgi:putative membrane protein
MLAVTSVHAQSNSDTGQNPSVSRTDPNDSVLAPLAGFPGTNFLVVAAAGSLLELRIGELALSNSTNAAVRQIGQRLVQDHTAAYQQAQQLAAVLGVRLRAFDVQQRRVEQRFESLTGDAFDRVFIRYLIQQHILDISRYEVAALRASNREIRAFARENLPALMEHLVTLLDLRENYLVDIIR